MMNGAADELLSLSDVVQRLHDAENEREKFRKRVAELETEITTQHLQHDIQARHREKLLLVNAAQAIVEIDRIQRERENYLAEKLKRTEEDFAGCKKRESELDRQLTQVVIARNGEMVSQARFDEMKSRVEALEREKAKLATTNMYLVQVVENCRLGCAKPTKSKSIQVNLGLASAVSKGLQVGRTNTKLLNETQNHTQTDATPLRSVKFQDAK